MKQRIPAFAILTVLLLMILVPVDPKPAEASDGWGISAGADLRTRWIYRGMELGNSPQIQPAVSIRNGGFQAGLWASHSLSLATDSGDPGSVYRETNLWMQYTFAFDGFTLTPYVQNHYNPVNDLTDFSSDGSHALQFQLALAGNENLPFDLMGGWVFHGDDDNSLYLEAGYTLAFGPNRIRALVSGTPARAGFNGTDKAAVTQVGTQASRMLTVTESFQLPLTVEFIANPHARTSFGALILSF